MVDVPDEHTGQTAAGKAGETLAGTGSGVTPAADTSDSGGVGDEHTGQTAAGKAGQTLAAGAGSGVTPAVHGATGGLSRASQR
jgi:hypothetical protein